MPTDADFRREIAARPADGVLRLAYADWLDEHADPRADLVRVETAMRPLPVFSDEYWELRAARAALRPRFDPAWLAEMGYGTRYEPVFAHGFPAGWKERWRLTRVFTEVWHGIPMPDIGGRSAEIAATEARLGRVLPPSVREWVAFAHDVRREANYHDVLRDVYDMRDLPGYPGLSLLTQTEGDFYWAVDHADCTTDDPLVTACYGNATGMIAPEPEVEKIAASQFGFDYALGFARGQGGSFGTHVQDATALVENLEATLPFRCELGPTKVYESGEILVTLTACSDSRHHLHVRVPQPIPREAVPNFIWDYVKRGFFSGMFDEFLADGRREGGVVRRPTRRL